MKQAFIYKARNSHAAHLRNTVARPVSPAPGHAIALHGGQAPTPTDRSWDAWFAGEPVTADFLNDREQPAAQALASASAPRRVAHRRKGQARQGQQ